MGTFPIGFVLMGSILFASVKFDTWHLFFNPHAMALVGAGTIAVLIMSTPFDGLRSLYLAIKDALRPAKVSHDRLQKQLIELSRERSLAQPSLNPLIHYATDLWEQGTEPELFIVLLAQRRDELERGYIDAVQILRNLAKYPPALGMTGTVIGLVSLFSVLGANSKAALGPALAMAMTATFFGLIVANCLVTPLADHLHIRHMQSEKLYTSIFQILILINRGEAWTLVQDEVKNRAAA